MCFQLNHKTFKMQQILRTSNSTLISNHTKIKRRKNLFISSFLKEALLDVNKIEWKGLSGIRHFI